MKYEQHGRQQQQRKQQPRAAALCPAPLVVAAAVGWVGLHLGLLLLALQAVQASAGRHQ
jgi:hypothetical protein